ncbi:hypothetical protein JQX13_29250 [Archangium violaceum]|uniref:hypothetical protein n=1 Tax=Archangium violaceum TaxID=83451 RepID=UPI00193B7E9A|nr:hypothetical protein [Archangium violaceum]QRK04347.1 hypothetical protein JQX13_29250 [Archangium violaceum]
MRNDVRSTTTTGNGFEDVSTRVSFSSSEGVIQSYGAAMSSFFASFGKGEDHHLRSVQGYAKGVSQNGSTGSALVTGTMFDASNNKASVAFTAAFPVQFR